MNKRLLALAVSAAITAPAAYATNGMNLEGYGAVATGMGGASMAYDNGTAAMMNNPATLGLMDDGSRLDVAIGFLGPDVSSGMGPASWDSTADAFYMPAIGWAKKNGKLTYGVGAFAQGGMGTEYKNGGALPASPGAAAIMAEGVLTGAPGDDVFDAVFGAEEFSEVGVMRILFPLAYNVNDQLTVGGSIDYVRASMDIKMAMPASAMMDMAMGSQTAGTLGGSLLDLVAMFDGGPAGVAGGYFDFADDNPYAGETTGDGFAGKIGFTYKVNDKLTFGGTYHSKTSLSDLTGDAEVSMAGVMGGGDFLTPPVDGKMTIKDFQWPETYGLGLSYKASDRLMLAADVKVINWAKVMEDFKMSFVASNSLANQMMGVNGATLDAVLFQDWDNQTVFQVGGAYQVNENLVARLGANIANNPIPDSYLNHLFPAIVKNHFTFGLGYAFDDVSEVNFALSVVPEVEATNGAGMTISHSQTSWQLMYSHGF